MRSEHFSPLFELACVLCYAEIWGRERERKEGKGRLPIHLMKCVEAQICGYQQMMRSTVQYIIDSIFPTCDLCTVAQLLHANNNCDTN